MSARRGRVRAGRRSRAGGRQRTLQLAYLRVVDPGEARESILREPGRRAGIAQPPGEREADRGVCLRRGLFVSPGGGGARQAGDGGPIRHSLFVRRVFKPAIVGDKEKQREPALPAHKHNLRFHDLRHTCASLLIAAGAHPKLIQARLGHASITTTLDRYGHLFPTPRGGPGGRARRHVQQHGCADPATPDQVVGAPHGSVLLGVDRGPRMCAGPPRAHPQHTPH